MSCVPSASAPPKISFRPPGAVLARTGYVYSYTTVPTMHLHRQRHAGLRIPTPYRPPAARVARGVTGRKCRVGFEDVTSSAIAVTVTKLPSAGGRKFGVANAARRAGVLMSAWGRAVLASAPAHEPRWRAAPARTRSEAGAWLVPAPLPTLLAPPPLAPARPARRCGVARGSVLVQTYLRTPVRIQLPRCV